MVSQGNFINKKYCVTKTRIKQNSLFKRKCLWRNWIENSDKIYDILYLQTLLQARRYNLFAKMFLNLTKSTKKLCIIREVDEYSDANESKLNPHSLVAYNVKTSKTAISTNIYGPQFLTRDIEDILNQYRGNPFFKAKLNYALAEHTKTKKSNFSMPLNARDDNLLATHRSQIKSTNELIQAKVAEIAARLQAEEINRA